MTTTKPWDLYVLAGLTLLTALVVLALPQASAIRVPLGLLFVLFAPGYALVAALFPERPRLRRVAAGDADSEPVTQEGLGGLERVALSLGLSIAVVPLLGLILNYTPWGIRLVPILVTLSVFTLLMLALAYARRIRLPEMARLQFRLELEPPDWRAYSRIEKVLTVALVAAVLVAGGSLAYVLTTPRAGETFTEFYILGPGGKAESYPTDLTVGGEANLTLGIVNHEGRDVEYLVNVTWVRGTHETNETGATRFVEAERVPAMAFAVPLPPDAREERNLTIAAPDEAGSYRLEFDLFTEGDSPYRELHLWVKVADAPAAPAADA